MCASFLPVRHALLAKGLSHQFGIAKGWSKENESKWKVRTLGCRIGCCQTTKRRPDEHIKRTQFIDGFDHDLGLAGLVPPVFAHVKGDHFPSLGPHPRSFAAVGVAPKSVSKRHPHGRRFAPFLHGVFSTAILHPSSFIIVNAALQAYAFPMEIKG